MDKYNFTGDGLWEECGPTRGNKWDGGKASDRVRVGLDRGLSWQQLVLFPEPGSQTCSTEDW